MSMVEGFMAKFDQLCGEICALRERVDALEARQEKPAVITTPTPAPAQAPVTTPTTRATTSTAKSAR